MERNPGNRMGALQHHFPLTGRWGGDRIVTFEQHHPGFYSEEHARRLQAFISQVSTALKNARLYEAVQRRMRRMQALNLIDQAINASLDLNVSLEIVIGQSREQLGADAVDILLVNSASNALVFAKAKGFKTDEIRKTSLGLGRGLPGQAVLERATVTIPDLNSIAETISGTSCLNRKALHPIIVCP